MNVSLIEIGGKACHVIECGNGPDVLIQMMDEHELLDVEKEITQIIQLAPGIPFTFVAVPVLQWNQELSPWAAEPVFGKEPFGSGAQATLRFLVNSVCPAVKTWLGSDFEQRWSIGGYSLAGLFALYAGYTSGLFKGVAGVSPSVWFPDWDGFIQRERMKADWVYLSLGDRESRARNPVMTRVGERVQLQATVLGHDNTVNSILEWNEGNHFNDPDLRTAKGFAWLLREMQKTAGEM